MEDLISRQNTSATNCFAQMLEAKRSLDGLLHSLAYLYNSIKQQTILIEDQNRTIRQLLVDERNLWDQYQDDQQQCMLGFANRMREIQEVTDEIAELRAI